MEKGKCDICGTAISPNAIGYCYNCADDYYKKRDEELPFVVRFGDDKEEFRTETQGKYLSIIDEDFKGMKNMLDHIQEKMTQYPVYTQLEFIKPLKSIIFEAWQDAIDDNNEFLNNYDGGDILKF